MPPPGWPTRTWKLNEYVWRNTLFVPITSLSTILYILWGQDRCFMLILLNLVTKNNSYWRYSQYLYHYNHKHSLIFILKSCNVFEQKKWCKTSLGCSLFITDWIWQKDYLCMLYNIILNVYVNKIWELTYKKIRNRI